MTTWKLRDYQRSTFEESKRKDRLIVNTPTGWGKSFLMTALAVDDIQQQQHRRILISVPQRVIAKGFSKSKRIELPDGSVLEWPTPRNLCAKTTAKVAELAAFIKGEGIPESNVVVTTHMTLSYALQPLSDEEVLKGMRQVTMILDESHHVMTSEFGTNALGRQVSRLLELSPDELKVWMATAYFFRGDHMPIISDAHLTEFERVHVPFDEYWRTLKHIKSYSYDFVTFKGVMFDEIETVFSANPTTPTIIYCPPEGHRLLLGKTKRELVERLKASVTKCMDGTAWAGYQESQNHSRLVIDLVDTSVRDEKLRFISEHGEKVAAILTVAMFREGADWVQAGRIIDLIPTGSDQDRLQRFGRLVRDCPGKRHISYINFFPLVVERNEEERRYQLTKLYAHFHASLVLENAIQPMPLRNLTKAPKNRKGKEFKKDRPHNPLGDFSESEQQSLIGNSYTALMDLQANMEAKNATASYGAMHTAVLSVLVANNVIHHKDELATQILGLMRRKAKPTLKAGELVEAGFDKVQLSDLLKPIIMYSGEIGGPTTLAEIRATVQTVFDQQWERNYEKIVQLAVPPDTQSSAYWWCTHNRTLHNKGLLAANRQQLLERIGWWQWTSTVTDRWKVMFDAVSRLEQCPKAGTKEYNWVRQQRRMHQDKKLSQRAVELLESISWWTWASLEANWESRFTELKSLSKPPARDESLYEWMRTQRKRYSSQKLSAERIEKLETIEWWDWEVRRSSPDNGIDNLAICVREGVELNHSKSQVRDKWAEIMGISPDQIDKYLRRSPESVRSQWDSLTDDRGKATKPK